MPYKRILMKKNLIIIFLTLTSIASLTYAYTQKVEAERQTLMAIEQTKLAEEALTRAEEARLEAELQQEIAEQRRIEALVNAQHAAELAKEAH